MAFKLDLGNIVSLVNLCQSAIALGKWKTAVDDARERNKLSDRERQMLIAAADHGMFRLRRAGNVDVVIVGTTQFGSINDPYELAQSWDAFTAICDRGLLRVIGGDNDRPMFMLTGSGFDLARNLKEHKHATE